MSSPATEARREAAREQARAQALEQQLAKLADLPATLEYLETHGVTVVGYGTDELPAFYSRSSGLRVDVRCDSAAEVAAIWRAKQRLGMPGGLLVAVPIPVADEIPAAEIEPYIEQAVA